MADRHPTPRVKSIISDAARHTDSRIQRSPSPPIAYSLGAPCSLPLPHEGDDGMPAGGVLAAKLGFVPHVVVIAPADA